MAFNVKTVHPLRIEESASVVDVSSDDDDRAIEKNIDPEPKPPERPKRLRTPDTHCSICLDELTNKCYSESCWHMFCFECLKRWATISSSCPLCKKEFKTILHTFNDQGFHETYIVPLQERIFSPRIYLRPFAELSSEANQRRVFSLNFFIDLMRRNDRRINSLNDQNDNPISTETSVSQLTPDQFRNRVNINSPRNLPYHFRRPLMIGHLGRVQVYSSHVWAEPLPDLSGRYRDCSLEFYRENPIQTQRLQEFILRDVIAIRSIFFFDDGYRLEARITNEEVTTLIFNAVSEHEIRGAFMATYLRPYLGMYTDHFCHELHNYANSPYDMIGYDRNVRYSSLESHSMAHVFAQNVLDRIPPAPMINVTQVYTRQMQANNLNETIVLDSSDSDEIVETGPRQFAHEVIVVSSTDNDSDIEILEHHIHPNYDLSYMDQPSTSTGIRDSLNRPNTRYNLRRRTLCQPTNLPAQWPIFTRQSGLRRRDEPSNYVSSSNDEEPSNIVSRTESSQARHDVATGIVYGKRKKKSKRSKKNSKKTNDSLELRINSTNQALTDCSSSDESDTRPQIRPSVYFNTLSRT